MATGADGGKGKRPMENGKRNKTRTSRGWRARKEDQMRGKGKGKDER